MLQRDGLAERKNRTIDEATRAMLEDMHMPKFYWVDVVRTTVYLNWTSRSGSEVSLRELYFGREPNLAN